MHPSHYPQVLRSRNRSRSPSPVSRRRVVSDVSQLCLGKESGSDRAPNVHVSSHQAGSGQTEREGCHQCHTHGQFLTVHLSGVGDRKKQDIPHGVADNRNKRSLSDPEGLTLRRAEPRSMAAVEIVNARHSINSGDHPHLHLVPVELDSPNNPNPDRTSTEANAPASEPSSDPVTENSVRNGAPGNVPKRKNWTEDQVEQIRRRIKFFFMDPYMKFKARRHIPWKMSLQILKIIIITVQLVQFGGQRADIVEYFEHNQKTLKHLLLKDWDPSYETMPYPPATGFYALYTVDDLLDSIQFTWQQYYNLSQTALASITLLTQNGTVLPIRLCNSFNNYKTFPNGSFVVGPGVLTNCTDLVPLEGKNPYDIRAFLVENNITIPFRKLLQLTLDFSFHTFQLNLIETHYGPICYAVNSTIGFQNNERSGQVLIGLSSIITQRICTGKIMSSDAQEDEETMRRRNVGFDGFVISICILSTILCVRSFLRALKLKQLTEQMFKERFGKKLECKDRMEFINLWYFLIIVNDIFTMIGASYKIQLETREATITSSNYDTCSVMLGMGGLLAWIGILRYLSFFRKYNILIVTLKSAFPNVLRFLLCALAMYCGFLFCGWLILSPYHLKFRHLSTASECLFSLVNGDDMFVTFSATESNNLLVWFFSRIYLYTFISLFIYCVLSLFIAVIMDTYETIKSYDPNGPPPTELWRFIEECQLPVHSGMYRRQHTEDEAKDWSLIDIVSKCCARKKTEEEKAEERPLLSQTI